jgi:TRAP-type C4-dicarboxylate transport system substrate-binding protein
MPYGEVYTALKTGLVDGAENNWPSYDTARHFEVAKYYTVNEHSMVPEILMFSKKVFDTLPADEQKIFRAAAKESVPYMRKLWDAKELESRRKVEAAGVQVVDKVDKKPFMDAMKPVYDKLVTDAKLKAMVKRVQDTK